MNFLEVRKYLLRSHAVESHTAFDCGAEAVIQILYGPAVDAGGRENIRKAVEKLFVRGPGFAFRTPEVLDYFVEVSGFVVGPNQFRFESLFCARSGVPYFFA